ncbi:hypothetical protein D8674_029802 [Pyrus ussuriensis x Pyrus communis]|uniref:Uncharacterized protein n=1 Tax=Pyrus ussuriensis x Pyrus communis TaxID=2448454 RepID=A0A5N5I048_9ROSA|nr:hypothetical protein D8674_029802 [Pyrus ussuriensis x Pyrus communis]
MHRDSTRHCWHWHCRVISRLLLYISTKRRVGDQKVEAGFPLVLCMENVHSLPRQLKARGKQPTTFETCEAGARFGSGGPTISHLNGHVSPHCLHPHGPCAMCSTN